MAKCKNCKKLYDQYINDEYQGKWCLEIEDCPDTKIERECEHYSVMSNADRIRSMTDEELAEMLGFITRGLPTCYGCPIDKEMCNNRDFVSCERSFEKWLQSPVEV